MPTPEIIAHRGASFDAPENTRASVLLAWEQRADAVEIDIHLSKNGEIIVMHDKTAFRTTGLNAEIADLTRSQIQQLDAGAWKGAQFKGEFVPTLDDILEILPLNKRLFIEIKGDETLISPLQAALHRCEIAPAQIVLIGFDFAVMKALKTGLPRCEVLWLRGAAALKAQGETDFLVLLDETIQLCRSAQVDGLNLSRDWFEKAFVGLMPLFERVQKTRLKLCAYTINDGDFARRLAQAGVDGITTDRPAYLREQLPGNPVFAA